MLLTRREVQMNLLQKFNELCEKANVKYVLHGHAAYLAYKGIPFDELNTLEVLMCQGDVERIADSLDDDAYYFESYRNNPKLYRSYMLFGFKNSLDLKNKDMNFNQTRHIKNHCIRITIHYIERPSNRVTGKLLRFDRKVSRVRYINTNTNQNNVLTKQKMVRSALNVIGNDFYNDRVYDFKRRFLSIDTWSEIKNYPIVKITGRKPIESDIFDFISRVDIDDTYSFIFNDFERYAKHYFGLNWEERNWPKVNRYSSSLISWEDYSKDPLVRQKFDEIQKRYEFVYEEYAKTAECRKVVREMKNHVKQSGRVIHNRDEYIAQKDEILKLYNFGKTDELEDMLKPLISSMRKGVSLGYTYSVDEDIDDFLDMYLRENDLKELADDIKDYRIDV